MSEKRHTGGDRARVPVLVTLLDETVTICLTWMT